MSAPAVPLTNTGPGYTIVTHVFPPETTTTTQPGQNTPSNSLLQRFLKGEPKALGTFQIVTGLILFLLGIVLSINAWPSLTVITGMFVWASLLYITAGAVSVSASKNFKKGLVTGSLVMNVLSAVAAGIAIVLLSLDLSVFSGPRCRYSYSCRSEGLVDGIKGVLLVFTIVQFIVSIRISVFACKSSCSNEPVVNVTVVANPGGYNSVVNPLPQVPAPSNQQWMYTASGVSSSSPPMENPPMYSPPEYSEVKGQQGSSE
ncbi:membrane-spanning 4-domains subfamily A member 4A-like isoform X2 [Hoplias malabaricus]|uniref:membrane-spanning 4-domains subfamily A member 4A-like isoform X2 n=1 Tax=Hoplias malabaricus TaxID=27720 RepID=UPI003461FFA2